MNASAFLYSALTAALSAVLVVGSLKYLSKFINVNVTVPAKASEK